ncbi:hypothetical protein B0G52_109111 [Cohnella sp. SGD-V74]|nr:MULTISPECIES: hypothetical protein [unclassified Cohnella]PRX71314.1 hypothetical protein B0G52_109111 [Cohnella sp. SGD-V74]
MLKLDGTYDKTGLPDPLLLDYYFRIVNDKISSLSIHSAEVALN